ncbi:MAG TPA: BrxE family protein [Anaerolineales bacterium]|nr:BrxE family protein [Anaerolineales bacterium]
MLEVEEKKALLSLRLLICRAAQKDSLAWWEDESLTPAGGYLLDRLFLTDPGEAGRKLALEAARTRYQAAFNGSSEAMHLFRLDQTGDIEHGLHGIRLLDVSLSPDPITTLDDLQQKLLALIGQKPQYQIVGERAERRLEIRLKSPIVKPQVLEAAQALAWACLEAKQGQPIFPYITLL